MSILLQKAVLVKMTVSNSMSMISSLDAHGVVRSVVTVGTLTVIVNVVTFWVKNIVNLEGIVALIYGALKNVIANMKMKYVIAQSKHRIHLVVQLRWSVHTHPKQFDYF